MAYIRNKVTQRMGLCVITDKHPDIMIVMTDVHLGWTEPYAYHRICMLHLARKDKTLKNLVCKVVLATEIEKFNKHMNTIWKN